MAENLSPEARAKKNAYIKKYNSYTYKVYTFKLRNKEDAELIKFIEENEKSICALTKEAIVMYKEHIEKKGKNL